MVKWVLFWTVQLPSGEEVTAQGGWYDRPKQCLVQAARVAVLSADFRGDLVELHCEKVDFSRR